MVGVNDARVNGEEVAPAEPLAEVLLREFPKRVSGLYRYDIQFWRSCGSDGRGRLRRRYANGRRTRRHDERGSGEENLWALEGRALHRRLVRSEARWSRIGNRRTKRHHWRLRRSERRGIGERKMKLRGPLKFLRLLLFAETAGDVAERMIGRKRLCVDGFLGFFRRRRSRLILLRFNLSAIIRRKDLSALEILLGIDVLGFFLLTFFLGAFLTSRFGDVLSGALSGAKNGAEDK